MTPFDIELKHLLCLVEEQPNWSKSLSALDVMDYCFLIALNCDFKLLWDKCVAKALQN